MAVKWTPLINHEPFARELNGEESKREDQYIKLFPIYNINGNLAINN